MRVLVLRTATLRCRAAPECVACGLSVWCGTRVRFRRIRRRATSTRPWVSTCTHTHTHLHPGSRCWTPLQSGGRRAARAAPRRGALVCVRAPLTTSTSDVHPAVAVHLHTHTHTSASWVAVLDTTAGADGEPRALPRDLAPSCVCVHRSWHERRPIHSILIRGRRVCNTGAADGKGQDHCTESPWKTLEEARARLTVRAMYTEGGATALAGDVGRVRGARAVVEEYEGVLLCRGPTAGCWNT